MGVPVTVDSEDLWALINCAQLANTVASAVDSIRRDVPYNRMAAHFPDALRNLKNAHSDATRVKSPAESEPMTAAEFEYIRSASNPDPLCLPDSWRVDSVRGSHHQSLLTKRLVLGGTQQEGVRWGGEQRLQDVGLPKYVARLTPKGEEEYRRHDPKAINRSMYPKIEIIDV